MRRCHNKEYNVKLFFNHSNFSSTKVRCYKTQPTFRRSEKVLVCTFFIELKTKELFFIKLRKFFAVDEKKFHASLYLLTLYSSIGLFPKRIMYVTFISEHYKRYGVQQDNENMKYVSRHILRKIGLLS
jgi:hypothetical protein